MKFKNKKNKVVYAKNIESTHTTKHKRTVYNHKT